MWQRVDRALAAVVGKQGTSALFARSLHLARPQYPWLKGAAVDAAEPDYFDTLHAALSLRQPALASAANDWLLRTFCALLNRLLGVALSRKLLQSVWAHPVAATGAHLAAVPHSALRSSVLGNC